MTDPNMTPDEILAEEARQLVDIPPERIPEADGLPDDVREGRIEDAGEDDPNVQEQPITEHKED